MTDIPVTIGENALEAMLQFCKRRDLTNFLLVADGNTFPVLGERVQAALQGAGLNVKSVVFGEPAVVPDEDFIFQVLLQADTVERTYLAVGDVVGHGLPAVEDMAQLRSAGRALAHQGLPPAQLSRPPQRP